MSAPQFVKICGITREDDAEIAVRSGATAVGFVFWPGSPRYIEPARARTIVAGIPKSVTAVGVFVNQPAEYLNNVAAIVGLGMLQLHGDESVEYVSLLTRPVVKAVALHPQNTLTTENTENSENRHFDALVERHERTAIGGDPDESAAIEDVMARWPAETLLLLDAHDPVRRGGTGTTIDWTRAAAAARRRRIVLAGGLNPGNIADAIERVQPFGVDVSSGVEKAPGVKDHAKVAELFEVIHRAGARQQVGRA